MVKKFPLFFSIALILYTHCLSGLSRDYNYTGNATEIKLDDEDYEVEEDEDGEEIYLFWYNSTDACLDCFINDICNFPLQYQCGLDLELIPILNDECSGCANKEAIYSGYLHFQYKKEFSFLKRQLEFTKKYQIDGLWPEKSKKAAQISDLAVSLFSKLVKTTALQSLAKEDRCNLEAYKNFIASSWYFNSLGSCLPISLCCSCFRFSDYYQVVLDLENYALKYFNKHEYDLIEDGLEAILEKLYPLFLDLYCDILSDCYNEDIVQEIEFIQMLYAYSALIQHLSQCTDKIYVHYPIVSTHPRCTISTPVSKKQSQLITTKSIKLIDSYKQKYHLQPLAENLQQPDWFKSNFYFNKGLLANEMLDYTSAISFLTQAISFNPQNRDAYIEIAIAHFERGELDLAIQNYQMAKQLTTIPPYLQGEQFALATTHHSVELDTKKELDFYAAGFVEGAYEGSKIGLQEFIPSLLSSLRGLNQLLWTQLKQPVHKMTTGIIGLELLSTSYDCINYTCTHPLKETLNAGGEIAEEIIPELKELMSHWGRLAIREKGQRMGYITGKYGIDIFAGGAFVKALKYCRAFKRANTMFILETAAASAESRKAILEEAAKRWAIREQVFKNGNLKIHWGRQGKHIVGHNSYDALGTRSILEHKDPQKLINEFAGTGKRKNNKIPGSSDYRESIDFKERIGIWIDENNSSIRLPTTKGTIRYSKDGVHIVPNHPEA